MNQNLPPLDALAINHDAPPDPPPPTTFNDLPPDVVDAVLERYLEKIEVDELCEARLLEICQVLRTSSWRQCSDPDDGLWKAACARFGLTERLVGGLRGAPATPTWHVTFLAMCKEVARLEPWARITYKGLLRGDDAYEYGLFSYEDDDPDEEPTPHWRLRTAVIQFWLHAVERGLFCMVHFLLRRVHGIGHTAVGGTALVQASEKGHLALVEVLLAHGANVHADHDGYGNHDTALTKASRNGHLAIVEVLLAHGADVHADDGYGRDDEALVVATQKGHLAVVEVLLAHGADVHAQDGEALLDASVKGNLAIVNLLLAHGADVHARDDVALLGASRKSRLAVVEVLLAHGADVHARDDEALRVASRKGRLAVVEVLLAHGADRRIDRGAF